MKTYLRLSGVGDIPHGDYDPLSALEQYKALFQMENFVYSLEGRSFVLDHNFEAPISEGDKLIILFKETHDVFE